MFYRFVVFFLILYSNPLLEGFDKVIIWGHKHPNHTHHYIHDAFFKAFQFMGYDTYWFDDSDFDQLFDYSGSLFLTEGQADINIPLRDDCVYILHNCSDKYSFLPKSNFIHLQVYTDDVLNWKSCLEIEPCVFFDVENRIIYMPWATDLLPPQIDALKKRVKKRKTNKTIAWVGTIGDGFFGNINQLNPFVNAAKEAGFTFLPYAPGNVSCNQNVEIVMNAYMAPAIVGAWQKEKGYIPCRIFKNISYGALGITNSKRVYELFEKKIVYHPDSSRLFFDAKEKMKSFSVNEAITMMDYIKRKHTYVNRIDRLIEFLKLVKIRNELYY